jgi:VanZ family protein
MREQRLHIDPGSTVIAGGMLVMIVYGSLYPFRFRDVSDPAGPFHALLTTWSTLSRPADILGNILFYVPFGFFIARSLLRTRCSASIALVTGAGALLSFSMEAIQSHVVGRYSAMSDVYANIFGTLLGATAGCFSRRLSQTTALTFRDQPAMLLLVSWWFSRLYPYVPVIDTHKYWNALKPLIFSPVFSGVDLYRHVVTWLTVALLLDALLGAMRGRVALVLLFLAMLFARILIAKIVLSPNEVVGGLAAVLLWITCLSRVRNGTAIIAALFITDIVLRGLEPFYLVSTPRPFGWIPFRSFMQSSIETAVVSFLEKVFTYGSLVWLLKRLNFSWVCATLSGASIVFAIRMFQVYLPGRSAEITDVIMLLMVAGIMRLLTSKRTDVRRQDTVINDGRYQCSEPAADA